MNKGDLMKLVYGENYTGIDSAIPCEYVKEMHKQYELYGKKYSSFFEVMNYNEIDAYGQIENIAEKLISSGKLDDILAELEELRYKLKNYHKEMF